MPDIMDQKRLYRMIETVASNKFENEKKLLTTVVEQIVQNDQINVSGGRLWQLDTVAQGYKLIYQTGNVEKSKMAIFKKLLIFLILKESLKKEQFWQMRLMRC